MDALRAQLGTGPFPVRRRGSPLPCLMTRSSFWLPRTGKNAPDRQSRDPSLRVFDSGSHHPGKRAHRGPTTIATGALLVSS